MSITNRLSSGRVLQGGPSSDVIGGAVIALLGLFHLFVLQIGGGIGVLLLFVAWPLGGGALGAYLDRERRPGRNRELPLVGALSGVFGAAAAAVVTLAAGIAGFWPEFIYTTFGTGLASVTIALTMVSAITWTVVGYVGGYVVRAGIEGR